MELNSIFFTVDGRKFLSYLKENDGKIIINSYKAKYYENDKYGVGIKGKVQIAIDGTIVRGQEEYLVDINDLNDILKM